MRRIAVITVVALAGAVAPATAAAVTTRARVFHAFTAAGKPAKHVDKTVHGSCFGSSSAVNRDDAWRCMAGNEIFDPCFSDAHAKGYVLCSAAPWAPSVVKLEFTGKLTGGHEHKPSTSASDGPWAIVTTTGKKCVIATGATNFVDHKRANFACRGSTQWLWGSPSRKHQPWAISIAPLNAHAITKTVGVGTAWF